MTKLTNRQEEIINAAIQIIAEQSASALSMRGVAELVGISEPALYRHFENKDDLLLKLIAYINQNQQATLQKTSSPDKHALEQLEELLERIIENYAQYWPLTTTLYATGMFYSNRELMDEHSSVIESSMISIERLIEKSRAARDVNEKMTVNQMALVIFGSMRLLTERWIMSERDFDLVVSWRYVWKALRTVLTTPE